MTPNWQDDGIARSSFSSGGGTLVQRLIWARPEALVETTADDDALLPFQLAALPPAAKDKSISSCCLHPADGQIELPVDDLAQLDTIYNLLLAAPEQIAIAIATTTTTTVTESPQIESP